MSARVCCNPEIILDPSCDAVLSRFYLLISFYPIVRYKRDQNRRFQEIQNPRIAYIRII